MVNIRQSHAFIETVPDDLGPWLKRIKHNNRRLDDDVNDALLQAVSIVRAVELPWLEGEGPGVNGDGTERKGAEDQVVEPGEVSEPVISSLQAGLEMAEILSELGMGSEGLLASILYRAVREEKLSIDTVTEEFGDGVARLIENVLHMAVITALRTGATNEALGRDNAYQTSKVREMLVAIIDDVRVALLKLAERTVAIRAVKNASEEKRRAVSKEVLIFMYPWPTASVLAI